MGPFSNNRIGMLFCIDAIPAFKEKYGYSLMPAVYKFLSLAPKLRNKAQYMMLSMLIPSALKEDAQKKYFDYIVEVELNPMATIGLNNPAGGRTKAKIFGITLDLPGRDKFLWLRGECMHARYILCTMGNGQIRTILCI